MKEIRNYCIETLHLRRYSDECLKELEGILSSDERTEDTEVPWLREEAEGLYRLLEEKGFSLSGKKTMIRSLIESYMKKEVDATPFESHPLEMISFEEEIENQYRLVDIMHRHFDGFEALKEGDYGCHIDYGRPERTVEVEKVLAEYFRTEDAVLVRGGGTGAIRALCFALLKRDDRVLVHDASMYMTTAITLEAMGVKVIKTDFNDFENIRRCLEEGIDVLYIQRVRQKLSDSYDTVKIIQQVREIAPQVKILVDENYAVNKVKMLGAEAGADASAFSAFKLMGIPGIGIIAGKKEAIDIVHRQNYSGGGQVQGPEASEVLRSLVINPVMLGVQDRSVNEVVKRLESGEVSHVEKALKANLEERIILVKLDLPIAREVIKEAIKRGGLPHPVGSESRYEVQTLFYRVAKVMLEEEPLYEKYVIRINPMRSGPDTVVRILKEAIDAVMKQD